MSKYSMDRIGIGIPEETPEDLDNLRLIALGLSGGKLIGPQYDRLRKQGYIQTERVDVRIGARILITDAGRARLASAQG